VTPGQIEKLSLFLDALDEWGCEDNDARAREIADFIAGGFDLSEYEDRPRLTIVASSPPAPPSETE